MTLDELAALAPYFREGERYLNGTLIIWPDLHFRTMILVKTLRELLDAPIRLIRGPHPGKPTAIDACCPDRPLSQIFMALTRLQGCSWGVYSGNSFHLDLRDLVHGLPARWMAVKIEEEPTLKEHGLDGLITSRASGWAYLSWNHARSFEALGIVLRLADGKRVPVAEV